MYHFTFISFIKLFSLISLKMLIPTYFACSLNPVFMSHSIALFCSNNLCAAFGTPVISWSFLCPLCCWPLLIRFHLSSRLLCFQGSHSLQSWWPSWIFFPVLRMFSHSCVCSLSISQHQSVLFLFVCLTECTPLFSLSLPLVTLDGFFSQITQLQAGCGQNVVADGRVYKLFLFLCIFDV